MNKETGGSAFPGVEGIPGYGNSAPIQLPNGETGWIGYSQGMTLRDYFAAKAMQGELAAQSVELGEYTLGCLKLLAEKAYRIADAMLEERNK